LGPTLENRIYQPHQAQAFLSLGLDIANGTVAQVRAFKNVAQVTFPLCRNASPSATAYGVPEEWSIVIDQQGTIQYKAEGVDTTAINSIINRLLVTGVADEPRAVRSFALYQNYPNPFLSEAKSRLAGNPTTRIAFELLKTERLSLTIYNSRGELVINLLNQAMNAGRHEAAWNGRNRYGEAAGTGVYFYELRVGNFRERKKMILLR